MGDNRLNSEDSRVWGTVPPNHIRGKALLIYWSFDVPEDLKQQELSADTTPVEKSKGFAYTILNIPWRTRWSRTFQTID